MTASISGGTADGVYNSVFLLVSQQQNRSGACTATLIAPNLLLTARHCVSPGGGESVLCGDSVLGEPYPPSAFFTTNAPVPMNSSPFFRAKKVYVPGQGKDTCGYDLALIILDSLVPDSVATPAVPRIDREVLPGEAYTAVGYGVDETGRSTGGRMQRMGLSVDCQPGSCGSGVESTEFRGEDGICSGDSGGPALDTEGKVVGVVSRGAENCGYPVYGTVTAWRDFIVDIAKDAAALGGYEPAFWVTTGLSDEPPAPEMAPGTGGDGPDDRASVVVLAAEDEACSTSLGCEAGLVCYSEPGAAAATATETEASCVRPCTATADCSAGRVCQDLGAASVCVDAQGNADEAGCSLAAAPHGSTDWRLLGVGVWAALFLLSARRRRAAR